MASADEYAAWIVNNSDKKGTPEFDIVSKAYQEAKAIPSTPQISPPQESPSLASRMLTGAVKLAPAGPIGMAMGAGQAAMGAGNELINKLGYNAGGLTTDAATALGAPPPVAAGVGTVANIATQAIPAYLTGKLTGMLSAPTLESAGKTLMQSALKPTIEDLKSGKAATAITTMLDEGISPNASGVMKLKNKISDLNNEISTAISNSPATVNKAEVGGELKDVLQKFSRQVNPNSDLSTIKSVWDEFLNHPVFKGMEVPVQAAQQMKQGTYRIVGDKAYSQQGIGTAEQAAQKALAYGLKNQIAEAVPAVSGLNAEESKLLDTLSVAERRALLEANKNPMGLSLLTMDPARWAAFMADRSAAFKALAARMLYSGQERIPQVLGSGAQVGAGLLGPQQPALLSPYTEQR